MGGHGMVTRSATGEGHHDKVTAKAAAEAKSAAEAKAKKIADAKAALAALVAEEGSTTNPSLRLDQLRDLR
jgi:hypothetical protein